MYRNVTPKNTWKDCTTHYLNVIEDPWYKIIANIQNNISLSTTLFFQEKDMPTLHLPITTGSISSPMGLGSDSLPVEINLFNQKTYLADSMQFMLEYSIRIFNRGCYYIMPSFRGEDADSRHLCQFYHSEAEIIGSLDDVMKLVEEYLKYLCKNILNSIDLSNTIKQVTGDTYHIEKMIDTVFPRVTLDEAIDILKSYPDGHKGFEINELGFKVINAYGEKLLIKHFDGIVWITHFDYLSVPFYQAFDNKDRNKALNADLLFGIGEVVGAGERHSSESLILESLKIHEVSPIEYKWYINMKTKYPMRTSGFGMGVERFILFLLKHDDIRDCQLVPRYNGLNIIP